MANAGARQPEEEQVLTLGDEAGGGELVDERAIHLLVEIKVKGIERAFGITKSGELEAAFKQAVLPPAEFVGDETDTRSMGASFSRGALPRRPDFTAMMWLVMWASEAFCNKRRRHGPESAVSIGV